MEVLVGATDADGRVLEDELGVALGGKRSDEIKLALREFTEGLLRAGAEDQLADWRLLANVSLKVALRQCQRLNRVQKSEESGSERTKKEGRTRQLRL